MEISPAPHSFPRGAAGWPIATLGLLAAGWVTFLLTREYAFRLVAEYGPAPDVVDALGRDAYVCRCTLPYSSLTVLVDMLAVLTLVVRSRLGWPRVLKVLAALLLVPTVLLHGLAWLVTLFGWDGV